MKEIFIVMDQAGFFLTGISSIFLFTSIFFTKPEKLSDVFEDASNVTEYAFTIRFKSGWRKKFGWWLIETAYGWFLGFIALGFILQIPLKFCTC